ncbi:cytochrome P450 [Solimonas sp. K1W22B-7]|uniref:cytochrome P450 n=1 Tax=Solimonas sp. K1W22B-7 TaxID=2303331 RepID=UPI000E32D598|nr:cytochrome P450 [Solimonas sp. K1W22B-7]AXQ30500.1 cytochrome P450 [Solimonas sp. K1W22B-7]
MTADSTAQASAPGCPVHSGRDDRKSAKIAAQNLAPPKDARLIKTFGLAREILRSPVSKQAGAGAEQIVLDNPDHISFFFLDGDQHRKRRTAVANYFSTKTIVARYHTIMQRTMDALIAHLQAKGEVELDELSFQMAVDVASEILGLTNSGDNLALARRIRGMLELTDFQRHGPIRRMYSQILLGIKALEFMRKDLKPAVKARRIEPREDVISYMVKENYSKKAMFIECLTYGSAGMLTTREFIVMAAWHLFDNEALRDRYLAGDEPDQFAILEEILRLEPVASLLHRRPVQEIQSAKGHVAANELVCISLRDANTDEAITGPCPYQLDPDRARRVKMIGSYMSFGDGPHRCPGSQVALHETRIFLDRLFRIPGLRLKNPPNVTWNQQIQGYELHGAVVAVDRA